MDFLDLLGLASIGTPGTGDRSESPQETLTAGIGLVGLPLGAFGIVMAAGDSLSMGFALVWLPIGLAGVSVLLNRLLRTRVSWTIRVAIGCVVGSFMASGVAFLLGMFASFYSSF